MHFGDILQLAHAHTGAVLATDVSDKVGGGRPVQQNCTRSCAVVPRAELTPIEQASDATACHLQQQLHNKHLDNAGAATSFCRLA